MGGGGGGDKEDVDYIRRYSEEMKYSQPFAFFDVQHIRLWLDKLV